LNLTSDALAQTAPIAAVAPGVADTASEQFGETIDTTTYIAQHPVNTGVAIGTGVANSARRVAAGDRGAGSDIINVASGFLGPGLVSKLIEAANAANVARQAGQNIERSLFQDLENGFAHGGHERPTPLASEAADVAQAQQAKNVAQGPWRPVESPDGSGIAAEPVQPLPAAGESEPTWLVGRHGDMPSPRPAGYQSHHGVNTVWMEENFSTSRAVDAPAVLMKNDPFHNATRGVFNRFRGELAAR
jgi:hypothetical protein